MRSTLFFIPHEFAGIPLFGFGWLLGCLAVGFACWIGWSLATKQPRTVILGSLQIWGIAAAIVTLVLPAVEQTWTDGTPIGLPIRGYGVMVLLGLFAGIGISVLRGKQLGFEPDVIIGLGFWMMLAGVVGARVFYVAQKWQDFDQVGFMSKLGAILKLTEGGLVIYGGVIGGLVAAGIYCWKHRLNVASTADLVAPGFLIGLSLGRIGCLLHGCCFGGVCEASLPSIQFPHGSGPYQSQLASGRLLGVITKSPDLPQPIERITEDSLALELKIAPGQLLESVHVLQVTPEADSDPTQPMPLYAEANVNGKTFAFPPERLPKKSLPTHPSQIYASINALLLCLLIWQLQPLAPRDGFTFCVAVMLYSLSRFLLEGVRSDEAGQLGTSFTIAQWIAFGCIILAAMGILAVLQSNKQRAWAWPGLSK